MRIVRNAKFKPGEYMIMKIFQSETQAYSKDNTVKSPLTDTLVSGQLYLRTPFQPPLLTPSQTLHLHIPVSGHSLRRKRTRTLLKMKIGFFFCLLSIVSGLPMYNNWLLAMKFVFNLQ